MTRIESKTGIAAGARVRLAAAALAALLAAACTPDLSIRPPAPNTAQWIQLSHKVAFAPGQATLSQPAERAIDAFVYRAEIGYGDRVVVRGGSGRDAAAAGLADARAEAVIAYLRRHRIPGVHSPAVPITLGANESAIVVGRYIALAPDCPAWSSALSGGGFNIEANRFGPMLAGGNQGAVKDGPLGCATSSALAAQIANPGDLVNGGSLGPGDSQFFILGMQRYRTDKTKKTESIRTVGKGG